MTLYDIRVSHDRIQEGLAQLHDAICDFKPKPPSVDTMLEYLDDVLDGDEATACDEVNIREWIESRYLEKKPIWDPIQLAECLRGSGGLTQSQVALFIETFLRYADPQTRAAVCHTLNHLYPTGI